MKIGIDLDEVIADFMTSLLVFYREKKGKSLAKKDFFSYNWWEVWGGTREEAIKFESEFFNSEHYNKINPIENSINSVKLLAKDNELFVITSRPAARKEKTQNWIDKHLPEIFRRIIFTGDFFKDKKATKAEICREYKIDFLLEDHPRYALECANSGIKVVLFDMPWNQNVKHKNITRVKSWLEALEVIEHFKQTKIG